MISDIKRKSRPEIAKVVGVNSHRHQEQLGVANVSLPAQWNHGNGWKNCLNNLRLLIQPTTLLWLISP